MQIEIHYNFSYEIHEKWQKFFYGYENGGYEG